MDSDKPKVLVELPDGRALIIPLLETLVELKLTTPPIIVVGYEAGTVKNALGGGYTYALQKRQLGTAHAVQSAMPEVADSADDVLVLYGDMPLVTKEAIAQIHTSHEQADSPLTMATVKVDDFNGWREAFESYGRVLRNENGEVVAIREYKDASDSERSIKEVNPSYFCINKAWLAEALTEIENENAQGEYYLTDLVAVAKSNGHAINSVTIAPELALGANTKEQLKRLAEFL